MQGVLFQHGDRTNGYGVYTKDDEFVVVVNRNGKTHTANGRRELPVSFKFEFQLKKDGATALIVNNELVASLQAGGLFGKNLSQGLRVKTEAEGQKPVAGFTTQPFNKSLYNVVAEIGGGTMDITASLNADKVIVLKTVKDKMEYDQKLLEVEAGQTVAIVFENIDFMQHNLLIVKPETLETVGIAADKMASDPQGAEKAYVPGIPEVLYSTRLVNPGEKVVLSFTAPAEPGDYPYLCTFPGHWRMMNGIMRVIPSGKSAD